MNESFRHLDSPGDELKQKIEEVVIPDLPDFKPNLFVLISDFQAYKDLADPDKLIKQNSEIIASLKEIGDFAELRKCFLFHMIIGSTPNIAEIESFDTENKDLASLMQRIINSKI